MWYPYFFFKEHKYEFERIKTHLLNKIVKMCSYWDLITLTCLFCFSFRLEPACLPLSAYSIWEPGTNSSDHHTPLCAWALKRTPRHPLHPDTGSGGVCFSGRLLVPHCHGGRRAEIRTVPGLDFRVIDCLLYVQRDLSAFHVPVPTSVYPYFLHWSGFQRLVPLYCGVGTRCWQAGV